VARGKTKNGVRGFFLDFVVALQSKTDGERVVISVLDQITWK